MQKESITLSGIDFLRFSFSNLILKTHEGAGEKVQQLRMLPDLHEDPGLTPRTHIGAFTSSVLHGRASIGTRHTPDAQ